MSEEIDLEELRLAERLEAVAINRLEIDGEADLRDDEAPELEIWSFREYAIVPLFE